ncbi:MAG: hypothetical protein WCP03_00570 [Candidatus Saccharibacteria bacterium]
MIREIKSAYDGNYAIRGDTNDADCIIAQSFGYRNEHGIKALDPVNIKLARFVLEKADELDLRTILQVEVAVAYHALSAKKPTFTIDQSRNPIKYLDSWEVLEQSKELMTILDLENPMIVAQAHHVGRVALQAEKLDMSPIVPDGLPADFDDKSEQKWTRSRNLWIRKEIPGMPLLKVLGKL